MKQFKKIFNFELKNYFQNKVFVGVTLFLMVGIVIVMCFPRFSALFQKEEPPVEDAPKKIMVLLGEAAPLVKEPFESAFPQYEVKVETKKLEEVKKDILSDTVDCAFHFNSIISYSYYVKNLSMYDTNPAMADGLLQEIYRINAMIQGGLSPEEAGNVMNVRIEHEISNLGKNQVQNFFYTYVMIFALYTVILLYGQMVAMNVATEKSSRAMELLITSAKPTNMMFGKVFASCAAGLIQLIAIFGSAYIFYNLNKSYWKGNKIINSLFDMPLSLLVYMLLFFILGFFIYAFLYGAIGSTASKLEDINTAVMPLTMVFIIAFLVVNFSISSGKVDSVVMKICSYIPFTSPMAMFTRIAMSTVPTYEIVLSIVILIASVVGVGFISAKIYRVGVLLYGNRPGLKAIFKAMKNS